MAGDRLTVAFGKVLRELRQERGYSQEELAHRAQTNQAYVSLLEAGKRSPSLETGQLIAKALQMRLSDLIKAAERKSAR